MAPRKKGPRRLAGPPQAPQDAVQQRQAAENRRQRFTRRLARATASASAKALGLAILELALARYLPHKALVCAGYGGPKRPDGLAEGAGVCRNTAIKAARELETKQLVAVKHAGPRIRASRGEMTWEQWRGGRGTAHEYLILGEPVYAEPEPEPPVDDDEPSATERQRRFRERFLVHLGSSGEP